MGSQVFPVLKPSPVVLAILHHSTGYAVKVFMDNKELGRELAKGGFSIVGEAHATDLPSEEFNALYARLEGEAHSSIAG